MSAVLLEFIKPYRQFATTDKALERLVVIGITAWNASLLPEEERDVILTKLAEAVVNSPSTIRRLATQIRLPFFSRSPEVAEFKQFVNELVDRKLQRYAANRRFIADYQFSQTEDDLHLFVMSTLTPVGKI